MIIIQNTTKNLLNTRKEGRLLTDGAIVVIAGKPNVGKSTLINRLIGEDRLLTGPEAGIQGEVAQPGHRQTPVSTNWIVPAASWIPTFAGMTGPSKVASAPSRLYPNLVLLADLPLSFRRKPESRETLPGPRPSPG